MCFKYFLLLKSVKDPARTHPGNSPCRWQGEQGIAQRVQRRCGILGQVRLPDKDSAFIGSGVVVHWGFGSGVFSEAGKDAVEQ